MIRATGAVSGLDRRFRRGRRVIRLLDAFRGCGPGLHHQRAFTLKALDQTFRSVAVVFIHHQNRHFRSGVAPAAEDHGEDAEEDHRQNETQRERAAVAAQTRQGGTNNGGDQSRNSLPVKCRNTDSRFGLRSETSSSSKPALAEASSKPPISVGCSIVNCAAPSNTQPTARDHPFRDAIFQSRKPRQHLAARTESILRPARRWCRSR